MHLFTYKIGKKGERQSASTQPDAIITAPHRKLSHSQENAIHLKNLFEYFWAFNTQSICQEIFLLLPYRFFLLHHHRRRRLSFHNISYEQQFHFNVPADKVMEWEWARGIPFVAFHAPSGAKNDHMATDKVSSYVFNRMCMRFNTLLGKFNKEILAMLLQFMRLKKCPLSVRNFVAGILIFFFLFIPILLIGLANVAPEIFYINCM